MQKDKFKKYKKRNKDKRQGNKMKIGVKVGDVMTRKFISVRPDINVAKCAREMIKNRVGSLVIKENHRLRGILTEGDVIRTIANGKNLSAIEAKEIMTTKVVTIKPEKDMYEALVLMKKKKVRWLPVVVKGTTIGMLTIKDILRIEPSLFDIFVETTEIKEEAAKLRAARIGREQARERAAMAAGVTWIKEGDCQECGAYGILYNIDGKLLCEECRDRLG